MVKLLEAGWWRLGLKPKKSIKYILKSFKMMGGRLRLCAACNVPSPGPTKRLYYQHRQYGPFFPILEEHRRNSNGCLFSGGRVVVCTGCASHLLRQWAYYEKHWTPLEKRTYTLLSGKSAKTLFYCQKYHQLLWIKTCSRY